MRNTPPNEHETLDAAHIKGHNSIEHPTVMMRKDIVVSCGGYNEAINGGEDLDLWLRLAEVTRIANLPEAVLKYRIHDNGVSSRKHSVQIDAMRAACEAAWKRRGVCFRFEVEPWRMQNTRISRKQFYRRYAWQAWGNGFRKTWLHYALKSLALAPFSYASWKLLVFGFLKRPDQTEAHRDG